MIIVGAGMAGMLAGHMLRRHSPTIWEAQASLPNNHAALLRFRTPGVGEAVGVPFKAVTVQKAIRDEEQKIKNTITLQEQNQYAQKVTGELHIRSALNLGDTVRWVAPEDLIARMATGLDIRFATPFTPNNVKADLGADQTIISTMPMPMLMKIVDWPTRPLFHYRSITTVTGWLSRPCSLYQTIYYPDPSLEWYRASLTGQRLTLEFMQNDGETEPLSDATRDVAIETCLWDFGIAREVDVHDVTTKSQMYGKLLPIPERERREFIAAMTDEYNIWSLGRFATWRQLLLDDVVKDVQFIDTALSDGGRYRRRLQLHRSE